MRWKFIEEFVMQGQSIRHGACTPGSKQAPCTPPMCSIKS